MSVVDRPPDAVELVVGLIAVQWVGGSPLNYLRGVRLELAHRDLQTGSTGAGGSVSAVADRWGFLHHGRFAASYRQRCGRPPRQTFTR